MRITYVKLVNFRTLFSALKRREIEIDFSGQKNKVILLLGPNGSGKTSLLSNLHPFAYPGNMDIRNGDDLIMEDVDGLKEIHFSHQDDVFLIKHHYKNTSNGRHVKSFFTKNGQELNPNGNVTSFKELVELHFELELDFLKLLRLGANVSSFLNLKDLERKKFISNLLSSVDVYSPFFKKISDDFRTVKSLLRDTSSKLQKLNIDNKDELYDIIEEKEKEKNNFIKAKQKNIEDMGVIKGKLSNIYDGSIADMNAEKKRIITDVESLMDEIIDIEKEMRRVEKQYPDLVKARKDIDKEINDTDKKMAIVKNTMELSLIQLNNLYKEKDAKEENLQFIDCENKLNNLTRGKVELCNERLELANKLDGFKENISKDEALSLIRALQEIKDLLSEMFGYDGKGEINDFLEYVKSGRDCEASLKKKVSITDESIIIANMELNRDVNAPSLSNVVMYQLCDEDQCPYINYFKNSQATVTNNKDELRTKVSKLENSKLKYLNTLEISSIFKTIGLVIKHNSTTISKSIFKDLFNTKMVVECMQSRSSKFILQLIDTITNYISLLEDLDDLKEISSKIDDIESEIELIESSSSSLSILKEDITNINNKINDINEEMKNNEEIVSECIESITKLKSEYIKICTAIESSDMLSVLKETKKSKEERLEFIEGIENEMETLSSKIANLESQNNHIDGVVENYTKYIDDVKFKLRQYDELMVQLEQHQQTYDDLDIIKESLSSGKGMPLLFVRLYLKNTAKIINELLYSVYGGSLEIEDFDIDEDKFKIPYVTNNIRVSDVSRTSQGETSFISIALSFALIQQSLKTYDILLLDEIDGALDDKNRAMFLNILDTFLESIGVEQVFLITHNNTFDGYSVDAICTTADYKLDNYKKLNLIKKIA